MRQLILGCGLAVFAACGFGGGDDAPPDEVLGGSLSVTGEVVDFETGAVISGTATVATSGLVPAPMVTTQGAGFEIQGIPENSAFQVLAGSPPTHRSTFSSTVVVVGDDVTGLKVPAVSEAFLARIATSFGVTPTAAKGVMFVRAIDANGMPKANVAASSFVLTGSVGPKFLDANLNPQPAATATSTSGWAVFFEVPIGVATLVPPGNATVEMATSPVGAGVITIADATVTDGAQVLPTNVSFAATVFPIFAARGCVACHSGGGPGKDLGGLHLDGGANLAYREIVEERPNIRVKLATPETSLMLTYPSREDPPDRHPNITFASNVDKDYLKILVWIREGAKNN